MESTIALLKHQFVNIVFSDQRFGLNFIMQSLIQGLLPGLEEGAEFYDRGNSILEKFCVSVEPIYFYTCLWQVMLQAPSVRTYGTAFLLNHYNRRQSTDDQLHLFGNSITLMVFL